MNHLIGPLQTDNLIILEKNLDQVKRDLLSITHDRYEYGY